MHLYADDTQLYDQSRVNNIERSIAALEAMSAGHRPMEQSASTQTQPFQNRTHLVGSGALNRKAPTTTADPSQLTRIVKLSIDPRFGSDHRLRPDSDDTRLHPGKNMFLSVAKNSTGEKKLGRRLCQNISPCTSSLTPGLLQLGTAWPTCQMCTLAPLIRLQHFAARLIRNLRRQDSVSLVTMELHWLPLHHRITLKLCTLMHGIQHGHCPKYIKEIVLPVSTLPGRERLRSAATQNYDFRRVKLKFGERTFAAAVPKAWNSLPDSLKCNENHRMYLRLWKNRSMKLWTQIFELKKIDWQKN